MGKKMWGRIGKSCGYYIQVGNTLIQPAKINHEEFNKRQKELESHLLRLRYLRNGRE